MFPWPRYRLRWRGSFSILGLEAFASGPLFAQGWLRIAAAVAPALFSQGCARGAAPMRSSSRTRTTSELRGMRRGPHLHTVEGFRYEPSLTLARPTPCKTPPGAWGGRRGMIPKRSLCPAMCSGPPLAPSLEGRDANGHCPPPSRWVGACPIADRPSRRRLYSFLSSVESRQPGERTLEPPSLHGDVKNTPFPLHAKGRGIVGPDHSKNGRSEGYRCTPPEI